MKRSSSFSVGIDIEEVARFKSLIRNKRFLARVFTADEIRYCSAKKNRSQHFAVRFAAKEAIWKALSDALLKSRRAVRHRDIGLRNRSDGKPEVVLPPAVRRLVHQVTVSLSHARQYVTATALVVK